MRSTPPSYWPRGECIQPLGPDRHHIQRSHNLVLISPFLPRPRMESFQLISLPQSISRHVTECGPWWGPTVHFIFPREKEMMWWWWCLVSSIWGKPQLIHNWPREEENEIVSCDWLWVILEMARSMALGHVVGRCDKNKMRPAFLSILHLLIAVSSQPMSGQYWCVWPIRGHQLVVTSWECRGDICPLVSTGGPCLPSPLSLLSTLQVSLSPLLLGVVLS